MRLRPNWRVLFALGCLVAAVVLPPGQLVARFLPHEYATRGSELYQGLWLLKLALGLNAALWLAWPIAVRILDASRNAAEVPEEERDGVRLGRGEWVWLGMLTILATILRCWGIGSSLNYDEIFFANSMVLKTPVHIYVLGSTNFSQFTNWLAWGTTRLLGFSETTMRLPALVFGVAAVPITYLFARGRLGRPVAAGAALLLAVSTFAITYAQEAKGYTATSVFAVGATWSFLNARRRGARRDWITYGFCALCLGFAHLLSLLVVIAHLLIALVLPDRRRLLPSLIATLTYVGGALALLFAVSAPLSARVLGTAIELHFETAALIDRLIQLFGAPFSAAPWSYALAVLVLVGAVRLWAIDRVLLGTFVLPVIIGVVLNATILHYTYARYFLFALPFYMILASMGALAIADALVALARKVVGERMALPVTGPVLALALLVPWLWTTAESLRAYHARERAPFKAVARRLESLRGNASAVAGGFAADKLAFYAPEVQRVTDVTDFAKVVDGQRPEFVVTFYPRVFENTVKALGRDPLASYRLVHRENCHLDECDQVCDGFIWKRDPSVHDMVANSGMTEDPPGHLDRSSTRHDEITAPQP
jgi:hypothetical protein